MKQKKIQPTTQGSLEYLGSLGALPKGVKIWSFNQLTGELKEAEVKAVIEEYKSHPFRKDKKIKTKRKELVVDDNCIYIKAYNRRSALKKVLKKLHYAGTVDDFLAEAAKQPTKESA